MTWTDGLHEGTVSFSMVHPWDVGQITASETATSQLAEESDHTRTLRLNAILRMAVLCLSGSVSEDRQVPWILVWMACNPTSHPDRHVCKEVFCNHDVSFFPFLSSPSQPGRAAHAFPLPTHSALPPPPTKKRRIKRVSRSCFPFLFRSIVGVCDDLHRRSHRVRFVVFHVLGNVDVLLVRSKASWKMDSNEDAREPLLVWAQTVRGGHGRPTWCIGTCKDGRGLTCHETRAAIRREDERTGTRQREAGGGPETTTYVRVDVVRREGARTTQRRRRNRGGKDR